MSNREFLGRVEVFCTDRNEVFVYDEITRGLYLIDNEARSVRVLLDRSKIYGTEDVNERGIRGIIKRGNELILVPQRANKEWIHYDLLNNSIKRSKHVDKEYNVVEVVCFENEFYLIPLGFRGFILYGDIASLEVREIEISSIGLPAFCGLNIFGHSVDSNSNLLFPIVSSYYYVTVSEHKARVLKAPCKLCSISKCCDELYILPQEGKSFFIKNLSSEENEEVCFENETANDYKRVIATPDGAFFCPSKGSFLVFYNREQQRFNRIILTGDHLEGEFMYDVNCSYWTYFIQENRIHFLPLRYRYTVVDCSGKDRDELPLILYDEDSTDNYYSMMRKRLSEMKILFERNDYELSDFLLLV